MRVEEAVGLLWQSISAEIPHVHVATTNNINGPSIAVRCDICQTTDEFLMDSFSNEKRISAILKEAIYPHNHWPGPYDESAAERYIQLAER